MKSAHCKSSGFTLLELSCSLAIGLIILLSSAALIGAAANGYAHVRSGMETNRECRSFTRMLAADLATAQFHNDTRIERSSAKWPAAHLGFLSLQLPKAQSENGQIGDLCAVHYYLKDVQVCGNTMRCLLRGFHDSKDTFQALKDGRVSELFSKQTVKEEIVAFGVVSFDVTPKSRDENGVWAGCRKGQQIAPQAIQVRLVIARQNIIARLKGSADWDGTSADGLLLGKPLEVGHNKNLQVYETLMRFGNDSHP
ncbi:MAG: prepilin-type N-terminal cleavage/methylation domain-containing protein [Gloeobacteraceae cyanobacterium ES-bin-144]|nr:prepilin-type N-terminal cleavage/methylation domain-containing protein [Verrucomicrobiales bacterium]